MTDQAPQPNKDETFAARIQSGIDTVEAWDDDPSLLAECRILVPFDQLLAEDSPYARDEDCLYESNPNVLLLKRLAVHFQKDVMTWVNAPKCQHCGQTGDNMEALETRQAETLEEKEGQARRVEVYNCKNCSVITTFPRYNSCRKLLETRQGRCGEYANLFGLYCRAVGFETRYVSDWTDHVWVEVHIGDDWVMADSCEGAIHAFSMYEHGWGKKLNYVVGITATGVTDVTPRYTRQFYTPEFQERRRQITSSEAVSDNIIRQYNQRLRQNLPAKTVEALVKRDQLEKAQLDGYKNATEWTEAEKHGRGRISGSLEWRLQRKEAGNLRGTTNETTSSFRALQCEQFYPLTTNNTVRLEVSPKGVWVSGVLCDTKTPHSVSVVVVDDGHLGCILRSRSFAAWKDVASFLQTIPLGRIVGLRGKTKEEAWEEGVAKSMEALGGFNLADKPTDGVVFLGRLGATPEWASCASYSDCATKSVSVEFPNSTRSNTKLRSETKTVPRKVVGRLPESIMPLQTQLLASDAQKRTAFLNYAKNHPDIIGYTTRDSCPVYLMDNSSFPFQGTPGNWSTYHYLPEVLVPSNDPCTANAASDVPKFDLPLEENFFQNLLGPNLLVQGGASVPTIDALRHSRLVGLYFSAHWCPPCKRFTPMLAELYSHLKDEHPYHGLEIVFVTSDRSQGEFQQYFASMPWKAVPFDETRMRTQGISMQYGVRGIPALVILDAVSGQVVSTIDQARNEVTQACSRGDSAIEDLLENNWLRRLPADSQELFNLLELSSKEGEEETRNDAASDARNAYLNNRMDNPWANNNKPTLKDLDLAVAGTVQNNFNAPEMPKTDIKTVLTTMLKYLDNAVKTPWNPKFRQFKLSNKIVDKATRLEGAIDLIYTYGMVVVPTAEDFMVSIPLGCDLEKMQSAMTKTLEESA